MKKLLKFYIDTNEIHYILLKDIQQLKVITQQIWQYVMNVMILFNNYKNILKLFNIRKSYIKSVICL